MNQFRPITMILLNTNYLHEYEKDKSFQKEGGWEAEDVLEQRYFLTLTNGNAFQV